MKLTIENAKITENIFKINENNDANKELELAINGNTTLPKNLDFKDNKVLIVVNLVLGSENTVIFMNLKVRCVVAIDSQGTAVEEQEINQECKKIGLEYICKKANELLKLYGLEDISIPSSIE